MTQGSSLPLEELLLSGSPPLPKSHLWGQL